LLAQGQGSAFENQFNPELAQQSSYFNALEKMMSCVEKNANVAVEKRPTVCAKEYKALRMAAFKDQLLYHHMNERFFVSELSMKNAQSPI